MIGMTEVIKNKNNIIPIVGVTIGVLTLAAVGTAVFFPPLFGVLVGMGLTPALLGVIAAFALAFVFTAVQQIITNTAVEKTNAAVARTNAAVHRNIHNIKELKKRNVVDGAVQYMLNHCDTSVVKDGEISKKDDMLLLTLSTADYNALKEGEVDRSEVSLSVLLRNSATNDAKEVKVTFTHREIPDTDESESFSVSLTEVNGKNTVDEMKAELDLIFNSNKKVVVSNQPFDSLINEKMIASAIKGPIVSAFMNRIAKIS